VGEHDRSSTVGEPFLEVDAPCFFGLSFQLEVLYMEFDFFSRNFFFSIAAPS